MKKKFLYCLSIERKNLASLAKRVRQSSQNFFLAVQIIFLKKNFGVKQEGERYDEEMSETININEDVQGRPFDVSVIFWIPNVRPNAGIKIFLQKFVDPQ